MSGAEILATLTELGVTVKVIGPDRLRLEPADRIPDELKPRIIESKPAILDTLRKRSATCAASCYEVEPGKWIHHPWQGCTTVPKPEPPRQVERECWHCGGSKQCNCIACLDGNNSYDGPC